jgi:hypothetical protein
MSAGLLVVMSPLSCRMMCIPECFIEELRISCCLVTSHCLKRRANFVEVVMAAGLERQVISGALEAFPVAAFADVVSGRFCVEDCPSHPC